MKIDALILVGCGGTGSALVEPISRLLSFHEKGCSKVILIDGDSFEEKNQVRQMFSPKFIGKNKAEALRDRIDFIKDVIVIPSYINGVDFQENVLGGIKDIKKKNVLIVTAVDNVATRLDLITALDASKIPNFVLIDPGNGFDQGTVETSIKQKGKWITPHPLDKRPDIRKPEDVSPGGCAEQVPSTPQLLVANNSAANGVLLVLQALLDDLPFGEDLIFECRNFRVGNSGKLWSVKDFQSKTANPKATKVVAKV